MISGAWRAGLLAAALLATGAAATDKPMFGDVGLDVTAGDPSVKPGDDFYRYANGGWDDRTVIPQDRAWYGENLRLSELVAARTREIIQTDAKAPTTPDETKVGDFYGAYMDEAAIEAKGAAPLKPDLDLIAGVKDARDLARVMAVLTRTSPDGQRAQSTFPVDNGVDVDLKHPTRYQGALQQGGLGLPDKSYYVAGDAAKAKAQGAYRTYVATLFRLAGFDDPDGRAARVYALEARLAPSHFDRADERDEDKTYNPMTPAELAGEAPGFDWALYLRTAGLGGESVLRVMEPSAMTGFAAEVSATPIATWRDYLAAHRIADGAPWLSKPFVDAHFAFNGTALNDVPQILPRWKRGVRFTDAALGKAIGKTYARKYFPASSKAELEGMVADIKVAMAGRIDRLAWMTPATKARAKTKLNNLRVEVAYPDHWLSYAALEVRRDDAYGNAQRAFAFSRAHDLAKLGKPVDRTEWWPSANPQTVNAFNAGPLVKLVFPAGYLEPPHFDPKADPAVNYGSIGAVIGHEITHSFDDQGAKLDETGALSDWWTPADVAAFKAATDGLAAQYSTYEPLAGMHVNGRLTLGENTADLGGVLAALDAYHASLKGKPAPVLDGMTGDQRFFRSYAQSWREKQRDGDLRTQLSTDPHAPSRLRALTVRNVDAWYAAFDVKPDEKLALAPKDRVRIW